MESELGDVTERLREARAQQRATGEILAAISRAPFEVDNTLRTILEQGTALCRADTGRVLQVDGSVLRERVQPTGSYQWVVTPWQPQTVEITRRTLIGKAVLEARTQHAPDVRLDPELGFKGPPLTRLAVPIKVAGRVVGVLNFHRLDVAPFSPSEIALVESFADQAAIAIENVRLLAETNDALERQTAIGEILRAMAGSPTDERPVLQTIAASAAKYTGAPDAVVFLARDEIMFSAGYFGDLESSLPGSAVPLEPATVTGRAILEHRTIHVSDITGPEGDEFPVTRERMGRNGFRAVLAAPLVREGKALGALSLRRREPTSFTADQIQLVETFAAQAAIAIENVRLVNETKDALDRQEASGTVLRAIAETREDLTPVFQTIVDESRRLCAGDSAFFYRLDGDAFVLAAIAGFAEAEAAGMPASTLTVGSRIQYETAGLLRLAFDQRQAFHVLDMASDGARILLESSRSPDDWAAYYSSSQRSRLAVPVVYEDAAIGVIRVQRTQPGGFTAQQIDLVETFAAQAAIAVRNVRLFNETKDALERQTATADVLRLISRSAFNLSSVLNALIETATRLAKAHDGTMFVLEGGQYRPIASSGELTPEYRAAVRPTSAVTGTGAVSRAGRARQPVQIVDVLADPDASPTMLELVRAGGYRTILGVPLLRDGVAIGVLSLRRTTVRAFSDAEIALVSSYADQAVIAMENVRLFNEIQEQSRQLEAVNKELAVASKHKSEFLANMSHELRTPLNAIIGFSDVLEQQMFGALNDQQSDYVRDISDSGRHLLTLVNEILDLAKVEAGRMDLEPTEFLLDETIRGAIALVRERAAEHRIELATDVAPSTGTLVADERKVRQVLLNLLSNAVKFTPDGGQVGVSCRRDGGEVEISVRDTGIGIAREDLPKVFEEFQQVGGPSDRAREGTGLGLTLAKRFIELHGGHIWVDSEVGKGTTFTFRIPATSVVTG